MHRETRVANYALAGFCGIALILLSLPLSAPVTALKACLVYVVSPAVYYGAKGSQRLAAIPGRLRDLVSADIENKLLQEEIKKAAWIKAEAESLRLEGQRLRAQMGLKAPAGRVPAWARVIEREPAHWYRSFLVDAGAEQGISVNAAVLGSGPNGLSAVGRVVEVRARTSLVLLLTDDLSSVAAYVLSVSSGESRGYEGLLQGLGRPGLRMNYLSPGAVVAAGDAVMTSATSATFPPDVAVGVVSEVHPPDPFLTFQSVSVKPALDASQLKEVMILSTVQPAAAGGTP